MAKLLVVDDERDILDLVVKRLRQDGHDVVSADGGPAALAHVQRYGMPDAVLPRLLRENALATYDRLSAPVAQPQGRVA